MNYIHRLLLIIMLCTLSLSAVDFRLDEKLLVFRDYRSIGVSAGPVYDRDDVLMNLTLSAGMEFNHWGFGVVLPLNFLMYDRNNDTPVTGGIFPREDWNDVRDFVSIITSAHYGNPADKYYVFFGTVKNAYMGNGTLLGGYFNTLRYRFPKRGVKTHVKGAFGGITLFTDDVMPPNIVGGRGYLKPWAFFDENAYMNNLEVGFTILSDLRTPTAHRVTTENTLETDHAADNTFGFDVSFRPVSTLYYKMETYMEFNTLAFAGSGFHIGMKHTVDIPALTNMRIMGRTEYRTGTSDYTPTYFNTFYDIHRHFYRALSGGSGLSVPKYEYFSELPAGRPWVHGYYLDLVVSFPENAAFGGSWSQNEEYPGYTGKKKLHSDMNIFADILLIPRMTISLLFTRQRLDEGRFFTFGRRTFLSAYAGFRISSHTTVGARMQTRWRFRNVSTSESGVTTDNLNLKAAPQYYIGGSMSLRF